jgi:hypothetical protein
MCQIEVEANVNAGDQVLSRLDVVISGTVVASHTFPGTVATDGENASLSAPVTITLSVNTQQVRRPGAAGTPFVPVVFNGNQFISLNLYTANATTPLASTALPIVVNNSDAATAPTTLVDAATAAPEPVAANVVGGPWFKGSTAISGGDYIAFSTIVPATFTYTSSGTAGCGSSSNTVTAGGSATTGINLDAGAYACAGVEGSLLTGAGAAPFAATYPVPNGPDGTPITPPASYFTVGSAFQVSINAAGATESRWNLVAQNGSPVPVPAMLGTQWVDNKAPTVSLALPVAAHASFDQDWVRGDYDYAVNNLISSDAGSGATPNVITEEVRLWIGTCTGQTVTTPAGSSPALVQSTTSTSSAGGAYQICGNGTDPLGNASAFTGASNFHGYDNTIPSSRYAGSTAALPALAAGSPAVTPGTIITSGLTVFNISGQGENPSVANDVYTGVSTERWGIEGQDDRSGFDQALLVASRPAAQALTRSNSTGLGTSLAGSCGFTNDLSQLLSDGWVRNATNGTGATQGVLIDCGTGTNGVFTYTASNWDRALNQSAVLTSTYIIDVTTRPTITGLGFPTSVLGDGTGGTSTSGTFTISAADDHDLIDGFIGFNYPAANFPTAGQTGVTYPTLNAFGMSFDNTFTTVINGAPIAHSPYIGRFDETCTAVGLPAAYPSCAQPAATAAEAVFVATPGRGAIAPADYLAGTAWQPTSASANVRDAGKNYPTAGITVPMLITQTAPVAAPWSSSNTFNWNATISASTVTANHYSPTSVTLPFFDQVQLWRLGAAGGPFAGTWIYCGVFAAGSAGALVFDNGVYRIWRWTMTAPSSGICAEIEGSAGVATTWRVLGIKGAAALFTNNF